MEKKVLASIKEPLFKKGGLPTIRSHSQLRSTVDTNAALINKINRKCTAKLGNALNKTQSNVKGRAAKLPLKTPITGIDGREIKKNDKNIVLKLLKKHVPDYEQGKQEALTERQTLAPTSLPQKITPHAKP